jgi:triacylglycerol lipase
MEQQCATAYPIVLLHGAGFRDDSLFYNYWGRIPKALKKAGARVFYGNQDAWGSLESNGQRIAEEIKKILQETGSQKVNIIAHSRGGLEARYIISAMDMADSVASLTTISTPHHGSKTLDIFYNLPVGLYKFAASVMNLFFRILGDKNPDFFTSSRQLSSIECQSFNEKHPNDKKVYYQSYGASMKSPLSDLLFMETYILVYFIEGDNDGLCSVESSRWGEFKGVFRSKGFFGISHGGVVDSYRFNYSGVDMPKAFVDIVQELKKKGF